MIRSSLRAILLAAGLSAAMAFSSSAQVDVNQPIRVKELKPKRIKFHGAVMRADNVQITVRARENERVMRTFTYAPEVRDKMQQIIDRGGYQYGDKVVIYHLAGSDVALRIKGKPSKPL